MTDTQVLCRSIILTIVDNVNDVSNHSSHSSMHSSISGISTQTEDSVYVSEKSTKSIEFADQDSEKSNSLDKIVDCYICAYPINDQSLCYRKRPLKLPCDCKNIAHADCLLRWMVKKGKCPTCRYDFLTTDVGIPGRVSQTGDIIRRHSEFRASFNSIRNNHNLWRRVLQVIVVTLIAVLRLYVLFLVFGKISVMILIGLILLYYIKKCYDRRRFVPFNVVFSLPVF